jgi:integrase/recombinase XerD
MNFLKVIYRTDQPRKDGSNPFCLQLIHERTKKLITIKMVFCTPEFYDTKTNRIKLTHPYGKGLNTIIERELHRANSIIIDAQNKGETLTLKMFTDRYNGINTAINQDFYAFINSEIELERKKDTKAVSTVDKDMGQLNKLKRFCDKLNFNDITEGFLADYEKYMRVTLKNQKSSSNNGLKFIRKYLNTAVKKEFTTNYPFKNYKLKADNFEGKKHLTDSEFKTLKDYFDSLPSNHLHYRPLKSFVFSCYTGLRYGDNSSFTLNDIVNDCITINTEKTGKTVTIPLVPQAKALINYALAPNVPNLNTPCGQVCNRVLKEVAKALNIRQNITTHTARHTFGCLALNNGVSKETVQAIFGHSTSKQTDHYARLNDKTKIAEMAKLNNV